MILILSESLFLKLFPGVGLLGLFIFLFIREIKQDQKRYIEEDRLGDEHIMAEIEKFLKRKNLPLS